MERRRTIRSNASNAILVASIAALCCAMPALAGHTPAARTPSTFAAARPMVFRTQRAQAPPRQQAAARPPITRTQPQSQQSQPQAVRPQVPGGQSHLQYAPPSAYPYRAPQGGQQGPTFRAGNPGQAGTRAYGPGAYGNNAGARPGHLGAWMQQHQNMSPQEQQRSLEQEPGFSRLPPEQQANMRARLQQLNQMPPAQRQQTLNRVESMERLSPEQRQHITSTMGQLRALPPDQKQGVTRAFASVRSLPAGQREEAARSYAAQMNPQQREAFGNLMQAEPYLPIQRPQSYAPQASPGYGPQQAPQH